MATLSTLPFRLNTNVSNQVYSGPVKLEFAFDFFTEEKAKPFFASANIWSRAGNGQFFTCGTGLTQIDLLAINQSNTTLTLSLQVEQVEAAAWVSLVCQLAQVAHHTEALQSITLELKNLPPSTDAWFEAGTQALFLPRYNPEVFYAAHNFLLPGRPVCVEIEFARDLSEQEFANLEKELEVWGCLLATGGLRVDFDPVQEPLHSLSFGTTSQLTPSWIRYIKQELDGPVAAIALLDHWFDGLRKRGIPASAIEFS